MNEGQLTKVYGPKHSGLLWLHFMLKNSKNLPQPLRHVFVYAYKAEYTFHLMHSKISRNIRRVDF